MNLDGKGNGNRGCLCAVHSTFSQTYSVWLILPKQETPVISQLRVHTLEHGSHLNRQDKHVAAGAGVAVGGWAVSQADTGVSCPRARRSLSPDRDSGSEQRRAVRTFLLPPHLPGRNSQEQEPAVQPRQVDRSCPESELRNERELVTARWASSNPFSVLQL